MRLWAIHPKYLDVEALRVLWKDILTVHKIFLGETNNYINHPHVKFFLELEKPESYIKNYSISIYEEALLRGYSYKSNLIDMKNKRIKRIGIAKEQLENEFTILKDKLLFRDNERYRDLINVKKIETNPIFITSKNGYNFWEKKDEESDKTISINEDEEKSN